MEEQILETIFLAMIFYALLWATIFMFGKIIEELLK